MRIGRKIKRDTQLIIISVIVLTITTLSFSYSAFFTVQSLSTVQEITTGNLEVLVTIDNANSIDNSEYLYPMSDDAAMNGEAAYSTLNLFNNGSVLADFSVSISYDFDKMRELDEFKNKTDEELKEELVSLQYVKVGIVDKDTNEWINFNNDSESNAEIYQTTLSSLLPSSDDPNSYPILRNKLNPISSIDNYQKQYDIYLWLVEDTPISEIDKYVYFKINVKCVSGEETIKETPESVS